MAAVWGEASELDVRFERRDETPGSRQAFIAVYQGCAESASKRRIQGFAY